jgi:hypothetical protein
MQYDEIINCPKSGGDLCYKIEVTKDIVNYFSLSCGFWTNTLMIPGSDFYINQMEVLPELHKAISWLDKETGLVWIPNTTNVPDLGMVYADGSSPEEWNWAAVKAIPLQEGDKKISPDQTHKMDLKNVKHFKERDYMEALSYIGALPE